MLGMDVSALPFAVAEGLVAEALAVREIRVGINAEALAKVINEAFGN